MVSAYSREEKTTKEYNGRQLLELLQNADDQESNEVLINLNTSKYTLEISNRGENCKPFSFKGIRSLMISDLSSKVIKRYIGNKGLGFRSIINWSEKIIINSNGLDIEFSRDIVDRIYDELFTESEQKQIREDRNLSSNIKPIPFLAIPKIQGNKQQDWTTSIKVTYKKAYLEDIKKQLDELKNEILLFLNHIQHLKVIIDGDIHLDVKKETLFEKWKIFEKKEKLPKYQDEILLWENEDEPEYYDLKIALQDNLKNDIKELFAFFPTKIQINFPFIVHGTFELNSSRNELVDSRKNRYILKKLVELIVETAKTITKEDVSYKALEMLTYDYQNNILEELGFYQAIDDAIEELDIFPCLDGKYRNIDEVIFIDQLSRFAQKTHNEELFENLLIPLDTSLDLSQYELNGEIGNSKLNELSRRITSIDDRVDFIYMLYHEFDVGSELEFLIDEDDEIIPLEDDIFTPAQLSLSIPDFVKIRFINNELYKKLVIKFGITSSDHKSRELLDKLKGLTRIQEYAFMTVMRKIVSTTRKELEQENINQTSLINKMINALYSNYAQLEQKVDVPSDMQIPVLSKDESVVNTKDLYLSKSYPSGVLTEYLFGNIFEEKEFLADLSIYDLDADIEQEDVEEFFLWLGVNKYTKYVNSGRDGTYDLFLLRKFGWPDNYDRFKYNEEKIVGFEEIIQSLSREKILLWFLKDPELKSKIERKYELKYVKSRGYHPYHVTSEAPAYIQYQILVSEVFKDYLVGNESLSYLINGLTIDFDNAMFEKYGISKSKIESLMLEIGAVDKFEKLSIERVRDIVKKLPERSPEGKQAQKIYQLCIKHFEKNHKALEDEEIKLYSSKNDLKQYFLFSEVYYNGSIKLPKKITNTIPILNYPRRQSTTNIVKFFGVNNLNSLEIEVIDQQNLDVQSNEFEKVFEQLKPFILTYRIKDIESDRMTRDEVLKLQNINIKLCSSVRYRVNSEIDELSDNDYIRNGKEYLIKIQDVTSVEKLRKEEVDFQESFADIIGLAFDIQDTNVFRDIIIKEDIPYIERIVRNDIGYDELVRARRLLGISDEYYSFWATVYDLLQREYVFVDKDDLLTLIKNDLGLSVNIHQIDYNHLDTYESCRAIKWLFEELGLDVESFNRNTLSYYKIDFTDYHKQNIKKAFEDNLFEFKRKLYTWTLDHSEERGFLKNIALYEKNDTYILEKASVKKNVLELDYHEIVRQFVESNFGLDNTKPTEIDFESVRDKNEHLIPEEEIKGNIELLSLLYFENKIEEIKQELKHEDEADPAQQMDEGDISHVPIKDVGLSTVPLGASSNGGQGSNKPYKHPGDGQKRKKGKKSEKIAYAALVEKYGKENVFRKSNEDDSIGYDLKYRDCDGQWKYVEVKSYSGNQFYLTRNEKEFADEHKGQYEIFLVGDEVLRIKDVDFSNSGMFKLTNKDYVVEYNLDIA